MYNRSGDIMKILRRKLIDEISELENIAINHEFSEGLYTIDIKDDYDSILNNLEGFKKIVFMPEDVLDRELNKRFIDLIAEAGIFNLILVLPEHESAIRENQILEKYIKEYGGFNYMIIKVPQLMDNLFEYFISGRIPKQVDKFSISSMDAYAVLEYAINAEELSDQVLSLSVNYFENSENYREVFDHPDSKLRMNQLKTNDFKKLLDRDLLTWSDFVKLRKLN